jgi:methionyl-tRNA formyltransferase
VKIAILCTDEKHSVLPLLRDWQAKHAVNHEVSLYSSKADLRSADLLFLISCHELVDLELRQKFGYVLVIHASALPAGRGWSPHIWQILEGSNRIAVTLLEADDPVDSGAIWATRHVTLQGHELWNEINMKLFGAEISLMDWAVENSCTVVPTPQSEQGASYYPRRGPRDSQLNPERSIADQFDQLRVADPYRYPAFFDWRGCRYLVRIEKEHKNE